MIKRIFLSEKGIVDVPICLFVLAAALYVAALLYSNYVRPPGRAEDLNFLNSRTIEAPLDRCEFKGILREGLPVSLAVVDENGRVVETVSEARVSRLTDGTVFVFVRRGDLEKVPPLGVNRLRLVLEPKN